MRVLLSEQVLREGVTRLADEIHDFYGHRPVTILAVMTGSMILVADLIRRLDMPMRVGVVQASSYRGGTTRGELRINADLMPDITGRDVLLVDDIFDTGHTLAGLLDQLRECGPRSVETAVLLRKQGRQEISLKPTFVGFEIPDEFVVGYGLDYQDAYRNLPFVAMLDEDEINTTPA